MSDTKYKDFALAVKESAVDEAAEDEFTEFTIGGEGPYKMYLPSPDQLAMLMAAQATGDEVDAMTALFEFLDSVFEEESYRALRKRIMNRRDALDLSTLMGVLTSQVKDWTGFPTAPPSASTPSQPKTGKRSTGRVPGKGSTLSA